jgi:hypothetical protein
MTKITERRWGVFKDYYTENGDRCTDHWVIIYGTEQEAINAMARLNAGQDKSWFDPSDDDAAAFLYVEQLEGLY